MKKAIVAIMMVALCSTAAFSADAGSKTITPAPKASESTVTKANFKQTVESKQKPVAKKNTGAVNKATKKLFEEVDNPAAMLALGEAGLKQHIRSIGLFNTKAKNVIALSRRLLDDFGGKVPESREELESLPGVGRKTANVVCNIAFGQPTIAVDTHLFRLGNRAHDASFIRFSTLSTSKQAE